MGTKKKAYYFGVPTIGNEEISAAERVLRSRWITFGKESVEFEKELVAYTSSKSGAVVSSCTAALHLALILRRVGPGDEIITTPYTFASTVSTILHTGAKPVFVDIDKKTLNIDPSKIEEKITKRTKGIVVVHFGGLPCDMKRINAIARKHRLFVNEDAAHAIGSRYDGKMIGDSKNLVCFSFYANKNLSTVDGGFLATPTAAFAEQARSLRLHGLSSDAWNRFHNKKKLFFEVSSLGYKYNTNDIFSAIGRVQLKHFESYVAKRSQYAEIYDRSLAAIPGVLLQPKYFHDPMVRHGLHIYSVVLDPKRFRANRDEIVSRLREAGIFAVVHYLPVHEHAFYRKTFGFRAKDFPNAHHVGKNIFTLPILPQGSKSDAEWVATKASEILIEAQKR